MNSKPPWTFPLTVVVCVGASLLVVWLLSRLMGFSFSPALVAVLCVAGVVAAYAMNRR